MNWNNSIFDDSRKDRWQNRDSDTHLHYRDDLHYTREDLRPERELAEWEKELIDESFN